MRATHIVAIIWTSWCLKSQEIGLFCQQLVKPNNTEMIKAPCPWPFARRIITRNASSSISSSFSGRQSICITDATWRCRQPFSQWLCWFHLTILLSFDQLLSSVLHRYRNKSFCLIWVWQQLDIYTIVLWLSTKKSYIHIYTHTL